MKLLSAYLTLCLSLSVPSIGVWAQDNGLKALDVKGSVEELSGFQIKVKDEDGTELNVFVNPANSTLRYRGTADAKVLGPGLMVRFSGSFDSNGNSQADVKELEVFRPKVGRMSREEMVLQTPGIYPDEGKPQDRPEPKKAGNRPVEASTSKSTKKNVADAKETKSGTKKGGSKKSNDAKSNDTKSTTADVEVQNFRIVGQVIGIQGNELQVNTGRQPVRVQMAADAIISVSAPDLGFAVKGDQIHVVGFGNAAQPNAVQAESITITGAKPIAPQELVAAQKMKGKSADPPRAGKADGKTDNKGTNKAPSKATGKATGKATNGKP